MQVSPVMAWQEKEKRGWKSTPFIFGMAVYSESHGITGKPKSDIQPLVVDPIKMWNPSLNESGSLYNSDTYFCVDKN